MTKNSNIKVGRNAPCPCGSGKKYKKCHGIAIPKQTPANEPAPKEIQKIFEQMKAKEKQREKQQGLGRPIISAEFDGKRFVAVGARFYCSKNWKTFRDFLGEYIKIVFGREWGATEQKKVLKERHPILQWANSISTYRQKILNETKSEIFSSPMTGAVFAYLTLSYNLYLLAHNAKVQARLIKHLKNKDLFYGALYETMVAGNFIKAGFQLELEDEYDNRSTHCEFTAISPKTKRKYSIEAKTRASEKSDYSVRNQLHKALTKEAKHERVVFIDLNVPGEIDGNNQRVNWLQDVLGNLRNCEATLTIHRKPAPKAYIFVTNYTFLYNLESFNFPPAVVAEGFKIPDLKVDTAFLNLRDALKSREKHIDMFNLVEAMKEYDQIPCTFDGEIPEYAFGQIKEPRLRIGNKYLVPDSSGEEGEGILEDAVVMENEKKVYGIYRLDDGKQITACCPLSEEELNAFRQYPDTFFGVYRQQNRQARDPLDLFDFFHGVYKNSPKEKLLEFMKEQNDFDKLRNESQEELAVIFCERSVYAAMRNNQNEKLNNSPVASGRANLTENRSWPQEKRGAKYETPNIPPSLFAMADRKVGG